LKVVAGIAEQRDQVVMFLLGQPAVDMGFFMIVLSVRAYSRRSGCS